MSVINDIRCDQQQKPKTGMWDIRCPKCGKMLGMLMSLHGVMSLRVKCPRCGTYIIADCERTGLL